MRTIFVFLALSFAANAQFIRAGVKGGVPLGDPTDTFGHLRIESDHWTVGPTVEFRLPLHLSFEIDGLYSSYTVHYPSILIQGTQYDATGNTRAWDIPAAFKFRFFDGATGPFVLGGVNYRRENTDVHTPNLNYSTSQDRLGPVFGAGYEWKVSLLRFAPEFRYTHLNRPGANQYSLLLGITF